MKGGIFLSLWLNCRLSKTIKEYCNLLQASLVSVNRPPDCIWYWHLSLILISVASYRAFISPIKIFSGICFANGERKLKRALVSGLLTREKEVLFLIINSRRRFRYRWLWVCWSSGFSKNPTSTPALIPLSAFASIFAIWSLLFKQSLDETSYNEPYSYSCY